MKSIERRKITESIKVIMTLGKANKLFNTYAFQSLI